ncbi:EF-P 5-aminopentanol modification-associated protein YfmF [Metaclostridioides mangenotii]|uniref:Zn-dependent peptidase n=1 Tax=Metaclostridioides mangenotii TaxID=1540 RepID=A0ABS4EA62_9FIRM|nr:pitrilysin family protein [Clostridioides mangenotii]MBP1854832.1 putative Zn-dependent peptidase [Clostridioides mangenotii]
MSDLKRVDLGNNINLTLIKTSKFKTNLVSVYIQRELDREDVTKNALLPSVITSGSNKYPTLREISHKLDSLYGASLLSNAGKRSEKQILEFKILGINDKFIDEDIFKDMIEFLNEIINNPFIEDEGFKEEYLNLEKQNLRDKIKAAINDKKSYAQSKCVEAMCKDERYSIDENGYEDDIDSITAVDLYNHYKNILKTSPIDIVVEGNFDEDFVVESIKQNFKFERGEIIEIPRGEFSKKVDEVKIVEEKMDITQGKLVMGYRANVDYMDNDKYYSLVVGNSVFGGGAHSKLFNNVREKESLCYYVYSSVEKYKSIMFVSSGIEAQNYEKAVKIIKEQLEDLKNGKITDQEISNSKSALINSAKSVTDNIGGMSEFSFAQSFAKTNSTVEDLIKSIEKVTVDDIVNAVKDIELDTVYFLRN